MSGEFYRFIMPRYPEPYGRIEGDTPFALAVNEVIAERWVATGLHINPLDAAITVLGRDYDKRHSEGR